MTKDLLRCTSTFQISIMTGQTILTDTILSKIINNM